MKLENRLIIIINTYLGNQAFCLKTKEKNMVLIPNLKGRQNFQISDLKIS